MKTSKLLYSQTFKEYRLSNDELKKLHDTLLEMLKDFDALCRKNSIDYMLSGGTLLGAIRHKGFIPWDDDVDVMMTRENYEKFVEIYNNQRDYRKKYILAQPGVTPNYIGKMAKIFKVGTEYVEIPAMNYPIPKMIFIDVFIIENAPKNKMSRLIRSAWHDFCFRATSLCLDYKFPSTVILKKCKCNKELKKYYSIRRFAGALFTYIGGYEFYARQLFKMEKYRKKSDLMCIPSGISYSRELFSNKLFQITEEGTFCEYKVKIPKHYDIYLKNLYGSDYMKLPPKANREIHVAYKCKCDNNSST